LRFGAAFVFALPRLLVVFVFALVVVVVAIRAL
jgi:hypothetical protein